MDNAKKKKLLIIGSIAVVVLAAGIVLYVVFVNNKQLGHNPEAAYGSDFVEVKDNDTLHVDQVVTKEQVKNSIGDHGTNITGPETTGVLRLGQQYSQTSTYTFTMKNGKKATVNVDARTYPSKEEMDTANPLKGTEATIVKGVDGEAHWLKPTPSMYQLGNPSDVLMVIKGQTSFAFTLEQPQNAAALDQKTARDIVLQVAKQAKLDAIK